MLSAARSVSSSSGLSFLSTPKAARPVVADEDAVDRVEADLPPTIEESVCSTVLMLRIAADLLSSDDVDVLDGLDAWTVFVPLRVRVLLSATSVIFKLDPSLFARRSTSFVLDVRGFFVLTVAIAMQEFEEM